MNLDENLVKQWANIFESKDEGLKDRESFLDNEPEDSDETVSEANKEDATFTDVKTILNTFEQLYKQEKDDAKKAKYNIKADSDVLVDVMTYKTLPDEKRFELHEYAVNPELVKENPEHAAALIVDDRKVFDKLGKLKRRIHHIDSEGYLRDDAGNQLMSPEIMDAMRALGKEDEIMAFIKRGGKIERFKDASGAAGKPALLFICERVGDASGREFEFEIDQTGTLTFPSLDLAVNEMKFRMDKFSKDFGFDKSAFVEMKADRASDEPGAVVPEQIAKYDKHAFGYVYSASDKEDNISKTYFFEYIVYQAKAEVKAADRSKVIAGFEKKIVSKT